MESKRKDRRWLFNRAPYNLRPYLDYDYINKLSKEEQLWLADFTDYYYTGAKGTIMDDQVSVVQRRESYGRCNRRLRDFYNRRARSSKDFELIEGDGELLSITPKHFDIKARDLLDSEESVVYTRDITNEEDL